MAARGKILTSSCGKRRNTRSIGPVVDSQNGYMHGTPISLAGCGKRVFGPLSTDAIMHYDVFYQAMNTEYWCPKLVFPQPARGSGAAISLLARRSTSNTRATPATAAVSHETNLLPAATP